LKEAEKNGALVIVPVWDLSIDMDKDEFFPNRKMNKEVELTNFMVVASSDKNGNPVLNTNYGATALDIYAPGTDIYSSYMGDTYQKGTGEGMASAAVRRSCSCEVLFSKTDGLKSVTYLKKRHITQRCRSRKRNRVNR
jgi:subtilisin family serine protease